MRKFKNVTKADNKVLSEKFSFLLKYNEDCTTNDFSWAAITIFDHWLYETDSFDIIENATEAQKRGWDITIKSFISKLTELENPVKYRYVVEIHIRSCSFRIISVTSKFLNICQNSLMRCTHRISFSQD